MMFIIMHLGEIVNMISIGHMGDKAMLSAVGLGWFRNTQEAVNAWVSYEEPLIPDESNYYNYEKMYKKFQLIYQNLNPILWEIK